MQIFSELKDDHARILKMLAKISELSEPSLKRSNLFREFSFVFQLHTHAEEALFYRSLVDENESRKDALKALEEHRGIEELIEELEELSGSGGVGGEAQWRRKLATLRESLEVHIAREEQELFKKARRIISTEEAEEMAEIFEEMREENNYGGANGISSGIFGIFGSGPAQQR